MAHLQEVRLESDALERFEPLLGEERMRAALDRARDFRERLAGRVFWNVNSTAVGGGVAEMLRSLTRYSRGAGIDTRWLVIRGSPDFFRVTKRLHHALHGAVGDGSPLGEAERAIYEATLHENAVELVSRVRPGDLVLLHDPQTAGLAGSLSARGARVIWRSHVGTDLPDGETERAWRFLAPYLEGVSRFVFSRPGYVPSILDPERVAIIEPSIDAFSAKNQELPEPAIHTILVHIGALEGPPPSPGEYGFQRADGAPGRVERRADVVRMGRPPGWETPLVVQVSRWDALKDPIGVMHGFARLVDGRVPADAELVLAGPNVHGVADDPEAEVVFGETLAAWRALPHFVRDRVHLLALPTADVEENAAMVNALQRHATVVVQKSLQEGFGLTVAEAMWKERPVLASRVGGIQDQIEDGVSGMLLEDPSDLDAFAAALRSLLEDPEGARAIGRAARERVRERFLGVRHLLEYARLLEDLDAARALRRGRR